MLKSVTVKKLRCLASTSTRSCSSVKYVGNGVLGLVREDFSLWERRSPLCPHHVADLTKQGFKVIVQPCTKRIFSNREYEEAGATIQDDLSEASLVLGVKRLPMNVVNAEKNYMFFSHVIKAQPYNMDMLDHIFNTKARLFDYECITQDGADNKPRLVAFGKYAGIAGMIDGLQGLGQRLLAEGFSTPFLHIPTSYMYQNLDHARFMLRQVGSLIEFQSFPKDLAPMVFVFTGSGNVANGAREIFELFPHEYITPTDLPSLQSDIASGKRKANRLYGVVVTAKDMVTRRKDAQPASNTSFDKAEYYAFPERYEASFHKTILPYTTFIANCMYWESKYCRLITKAQIQELYASGNRKLKFISDISCDPQGSVEFMSHCSTIENPFFTYVPSTNEDSVIMNKDGVGMLSVEILPTELPRDASEHFGKALMPLLPPLLRSKGSTSTTDMSDLPPELRRACIASHGELAPKWTYIARLRAMNQAAVSAQKAEFVGTVELRGHLFDSGVINRVFDALEESQLKFSVLNCDVRPNKASVAVPSNVKIEVTGPKTDVDAVALKLQSIVESVSEAKATVNMQASSTPITTNIKVTSPKRVLLLGSGMVAAPVVKLLATHEDIHLTIASDNLNQAKGLLPHAPASTSTTQLIMPRDANKISQLVNDHDVVVSLLPATMHTSVAKAALQHKRHMVTASYVSEDMRKMDEQAKAAGIVLMNEVGLDPGIDHMLIMSAVDEIHKRGGEVTSLVSLCGGLPDPVAADNPLRYKFSWSPKGVLTAAGNAATYLENGKIIEIPSEKLLLSGYPSDRFPTMRLEALPNRNSLLYKELYGVQKVHSICRGTLRYEGWSNAMYAMKALKLFSNDILTVPSIAHYLQSMGIRDRDSLFAYLTQQGVKDVPAATFAIEWLGLLDPATTAVQGEITVIDSLCSLLQSKLQFGSNEKDMVAMFHSVTGSFPDGSSELHTSRLLAFGTPGSDSAMAATVGYTTAAAVELVLYGGLNRTGVVIPTVPDVYQPILKRLTECNITWTEDVEKFAPRK